MLENIWETTESKIVEEQLMLGDGQAEKSHKAWEVQKRRQAFGRKGLKPQILSESSIQ